MKDLKRGLMTMALMLGLPTVAAGPAHGGFVFSDDFDGERLGLFRNRLSNFIVMEGNVDVVGRDRSGNSFFDVLPGNGAYVDLDGSLNNSGILVADPISLGPGTYVLSFDLAGSNRDEANPPTDIVTVSVTGDARDDYAQQTYVLERYDPFATREIRFVLIAEDRISFCFQNPGDDNYGALLDQVRITAVPEPSSLALCGVPGLAGLAYARVRRKAA